MRGTVYKLVIKIREKNGPLQCETTHTYVGSTGRTLKNRLAGHTSAAIKGATSTLYDKMRAASQVGIVAIESRIFDSEKELRAREEYYRRCLMPDLNTRRCALSAAEKAEYAKKKCAAYYQLHKDDLSRRALDRYYRLKAEAAAPSTCPPIPVNT